MNNTKKRGKKIRKIILIIILVLMLGAAGYMVYNMLRQEYKVTYDSYTAKTGSISNSLSFSGNLQLIDSASYTAGGSGTVRKVYVKAGDEVKDGAKLMRLSNGQTIEADFDGRVNVLNFDEGDDVYAGDTLVQVADFKHMSVAFRVDEYDINEVSVGQACTITTTANEKSFSSTVASIDYISASGGNVAYYSAMTYVDVDEGVYPGMQVTVTIPQESAENVVILKVEALSFDETNSAYVWMYNDAGELEKKSVEVGVSNGNYIEIKEGLKDGDEVYVEAKEEEKSSGISSLFSGMFGSTQINRQRGGMSGGNMRDFGGGNGGSWDGGSRNGGGSGSSRGNSGNGGGFGGGR